VLGENSGLFWPDVLFNGHVFELAGFKNVATLLAFYKFSVFEIDGFWVEFIFEPRRISARACSRIGGILSLSGRKSSASGRQEMPYSRKWMIKAAYGVAAKAWDKCPQSGPFPP
jgi:hypothetical protein